MFDYLIEKIHIVIYIQYICTRKKCILRDDTLFVAFKIDFLEYFVLCQNLKFSKFICEIFI